MPRRLASLLLLLALPALATTLVAMDVATLTRASDCVLQARVESVRSHRSAAGRITTVVELTRVDTWAGRDVPSLRMLVPGGVVDGIGQRVEGAPGFVPGEEVVLFLAARGSSFQTVGLGQGVWRVERTAGAEARVRPDAQDGVLLVTPPGTQATPALRVPMSLERLRAQVEAARTR